MQTKYKDLDQIWLEINRIDNHFKGDPIAATIRSTCLDWLLDYLDKHGYDMANCMGNICFTPKSKWPFAWKSGALYILTKEIKECKCSGKPEDHRNHIRIYKKDEKVEITIHHEPSLTHRIIKKVSEDLAGKINQEIREKNPDCLI